MNPIVGSNSIGAILLQKDPKTLLMRPIYFAIWVMKLTDEAYIAMEKIVVALKFAVIITIEDTFLHVL